jgi:hypothetical protein
MRKQNCWEAKGCERQPGGLKADELGVCPAAVLHEADGIHGGLYGGRACWGIVGTLCAGQVQSDIAAKLRHCIGCAFRDQVVAEEGNVLSPPQIRARIDSCVGASGLDPRR